MHIYIYAVNLKQKKVSFISSRLLVSRMYRGGRKMQKEFGGKKLK